VANIGRRFGGAAAKPQRLLSDLNRLETGQGVRGATIAIVERVAQALGWEVVIQFDAAATKRERAEKVASEQDGAVSSTSRRRVVRTWAGGRFEPKPIMNFVCTEPVG
jgi:hypothetical protein